MTTKSRPLPLLFTACLALGCAAPGDPLDDGADDAFLSGKADGAGLTADEERGILELANNPAITALELNASARLDKRAAAGIVAARPLADLPALDAVSYVGAVALEKLRVYARAKGYPKGDGTDLEVVFSPQPYDNSHNVRVANLIASAQRSVDVAMYSYSDAKIADALTTAIARGVKVRFLFDTASEDRKLAGDALASSKSGRLERQGVEVRWVNKIMHHKFALIDGPRDDADSAKTCTLVTGSANWSSGGATKYDENTLFLTGYTELALRFQNEFNLLWAHSSEVALGPAPYELSTWSVSDGALAAADSPATEVLFTSANFTVSGPTFRIAGRDTISTALVAAIQSARKSIHLASGHLRSRPVAEALIAKRAANPEVDIRVYLDGQEYISAWEHGGQQIELDKCLVAAGTSAAKIRDCYDSGFLFAYAVGSQGIPVRFKYYAYRFDASYAEQMHHKYMIVDGDTLFTGSYNLSDNAEHQTFENMMVFRGAGFAGLTATYEQNFAKIWETGRAEGRLATLTAEVKASSDIPLVFPGMALTYDEVTSLKAVIKANCAVINAEDYRLHPELHRFCPRT